MRLIGILCLLLLLAACSRAPAPQAQRAPASLPQIGDFRVSLDRVWSAAGQVDDPHAAYHLQQALRAELRANGLLWTGSGERLNLSVIISEQRGSSGNLLRSGNPQTLKLSADLTTPHERLDRFDIALAGPSLEEAAAAAARQLSLELSRRLQIEDIRRSAQPNHAVAKAPVQTSPARLSEPLARELIQPRPETALAPRPHPEPLDAPAPQFPDVLVPYYRASEDALALVSRAAPYDQLRHATRKVESAWSGIERSPWPSDLLVEREMLRHAEAAWEIGVWVWALNLTFAHPPVEANAHYRQLADELERFVADLDASLTQPLEDAYMHQERVYFDYAAFLYREARNRIHTFLNPPVPEVEPKEERVRTYLPTELLTEGTLRSGNAPVEPPAEDPEQDP